MGKKIIDFENGLSIGNFRQEHLMLKNKQCLSRGRDALYLICNQIRQNYAYYQILLPAFICNVVPRIFLENDLLVEYYDIHDDMSMDIASIEKIARGNKVILLYVNYFGFNQQEEDVKRFVSRGFVFIEDNSQASLNKSVLGKVNGTGWSFSSYRKIMPCADGASLIFYNTDQNLRGPLKKAEKKYLLARRIGLIFKTAAIVFPNHYSDALRQEMFTYTVKKINYALPAQISGISHWQINHANVELIRSRRRSNYFYLRDRISNRKIQQIIKSLRQEETPFGMPLCVENQNSFVEALRKCKIVAAILWDKNQIKDNGECPNAINLAEKILVLPVGQSYNKKDMERIVECLNNVA